MSGEEDITDNINSGKKQSVEAHWVVFSILEDNSVSVSVWHCGGHQQTSANNYSGLYILKYILFSSLSFVKFPMHSLK